MKKIGIIFCVILLFISFFTLNIYAADEVDPMYCIDITWGNFSFVYDKGSWNTDTLEYQKALSSIGPAKDTIDGGIGWYGFNGESNKISVTNSSKNKDVNVTLTATSEIKDTESNVTGTSTYTGIKYSIYATNTWDNFAGKDDTNNSTIDVTIKSDETLEFFLSISGKPNEELPETPVQIGSFTVTVNK